MRAKKLRTKVVGLVAAVKDAKRVWWANETSYYDYYPY